MKEKYPHHRDRLKLANKAHKYCKHLKQAFKVKVGEKAITHSKVMCNSCLVVMVRKKYTIQ